MRRLLNEMIAKSDAPVHALGSSMSMAVAQECLSVIPVFQHKIKKFFGVGSSVSHQRLHCSYIKLSLDLSNADNVTWSEIEHYAKCFCF